MRNVVVLKGAREKSIGLIGMSPIPPDTYFVFEDVRPGTLFHSEGVLEPFDIAFLDNAGKPILITEVIPPDGLIAAPLGTRKVVESKAGYLRGLMGMGSTDPDNADIAKDIALPVVGALVGIGVISYAATSVMGGVVRRLLIGAGGAVTLAAIIPIIRAFSPRKS
jgi:hypothetical protein